MKSIAFLFLLTSAANAAEPLTMADIKCYTDGQTHLSRCEDNFTHRHAIPAGWTHDQYINECMQVLVANHIGTY